MCARPVSCLRGLLRCHGREKTGLKTLPALNPSKEMNEHVSFHRGLKISVFPGTESSEKNEKQFNTRLYLGKKGSGLDEST